MKKLLLSTMAAAALSANDTELEALKAQLAQMQQMMTAMQSKIDALENGHTEEHASKPAEAAASEHSEHSEHGMASPLEFALFVDGSYVSRSKKDEFLQNVELPGLASGLYSVDSPYNAENGFNLNYVELLMHSEITSDLDVTTLLHFSKGSAEIEEAYFTANNLPYNLKVKGGKFLSDFGYLNRQHHHAWDFSDMPLVYEAFLGGEGLNEIGAQLQWTAPIKPHLMLGVEALQGKNDAMFGHTSISNSTGDILASSASQPSLIVGYAKTAADIGKTQIRAGASIAHGNTRLDHLAENEAYAFSGTSNLYGLDLAIKHNFAQEQSLTWQSEWLYRDRKGTEFTTTDVSLEKKQAGYYTQLIYAHDDDWRGGIRYDAIYQNNVYKDGIDQTMPENMDQLSAMIEYTMNDIARYRLQYTHSNAFFYNDVRQNIDSILFSINFTLGKHSHHPF